MHKHTVTLTIYDDENDSEEEVEFPGKNEVCSRCDGFGTHVDPNIDGNGITASEWEEWDQEDRESYMDGEYDVTCEECSGDKVVMVPDVSLCSSEQKEQLRLYDKQQEHKAQWDAEDRYVARMGF